MDKYNAFILFLYSGFPLMIYSFVNANVPNSFGTITKLWDLEQYKHVDYSIGIVPCSKVLHNSLQQ